MNGLAETDTFPICLLRLGRDVPRTKSNYVSRSGHAEAFRKVTCEDAPRTYQEIRGVVFFFEN